MIPELSVRLVQSAQPEPWELPAQLELLEQPELLELMAQLAP